MRKYIRLVVVPIAMIIMLVAGIVFTPRASLSAERICAAAWDAISGQIYSVEIDGVDYRMAFSYGYVGPCPQGDVWLYVGDDADAVARWRYTTTDDTVSVLDPDTFARVLWFFRSATGDLVLIPGDTIIIHRMDGPAGQPPPAEAGGLKE
jgi:hypothetical protein